MQKTLLVLAIMTLLGQTNAPGHLMAFDTARSKMTVYVYKEGLFAFAADNHEVDVPISDGSFNPATQVVQLTVDARRMQVLDPPSRKDKVQANMDGPQVLDVDRYPAITFRSAKINMTDADHWTVTGDLTLHGQTHPIDVSVTRGGPNHYTGFTTITQTAFGITPIRIAGGTVRVKNDVKVDFDVVLK